MRSIFLIWRCSLVFCFFLSTFSCYGTILHIPANYATIQAASDVASEGDTLLLDHGYYQESVTLRDRGIILASRFILDQDSNHIDNTIWAPEQDNSRAITVDSTVTTGITITGLTFANSNFHENGSGTVLMVFDIDVNVNHCYIYNNEGRSGPLGFYNCNITLLDNKLYDNTSDIQGGAVITGHCYATIERNIFRNNSGDIAGGAISMSQTSAVIRYNEFISNYSDGLGGGAIYSSSDENGNTDIVVISDNEFRGNYGAFGGAIWTLNVNTLDISNNLFIGNRAYHPVYPPFGAAIYLGPGSSEVEIYNNEFYYNNSLMSGGAITFASNALFHDNLLFRNEGSTHYMLNTTPSNNNHGIHVLVEDNLFFQNSIISDTLDNDYGCIGVSDSHFLTAHSNDFYGSYTYAAGEYPPFHGVLNVENNYWGHESGPYHPTQNPEGLGDAVMEAVDILPFATEPFTTRWLHAPEPLELILPEADEFLNEDSVVFLWHAAPDSTPHDTIRYTLELSDSPSFINLQLYYTDEDTTVTVTGLNYESDYYWRVKATDIYDLSTYSEEIRSFMVVSVDENEFTTIPTEWSIERMYPNPFNRMMHVIIAVPNPEPVRIAVYDLQGRLVETLHHGSITAGHHRFVWRPETATGMYFVRVSTASWQEMRKVVYLK